MRRNIVIDGADQLTYEIRGIVNFAKEIEKEGQEIYWENVGDPVEKGQEIPIWMKEIVKNLVDNNLTWAYSPTKGLLETRKYLAEKVNKRKNAYLDPENIVFFNGLGDAISKVYSLLRRQARVISPNPSYPTHSSAEAAHSGYEPITYNLDPKNNWLPDLKDLELKVKYNDSIVGILIINPDNPTGMVYPEETLKKIVELAKKYNLFLISDEIYHDLTYNNKKAISISDLIEDVPTIIMKGISKELPWPGSRCGWVEFYNVDKDENFKRYVKSIVDSKMLEVCSTTLPQAAIPEIYSHPNYELFRKERTNEIEKRANYIYEELKNVNGIIVNKTYGAFYTSIIFEKEKLTKTQKLHIFNENVKRKVEKKINENNNQSLDFNFVYYLLGATGICVVPISSFASDLLGFRITLLEKDFEKFKKNVKILKEKIIEYLNS
jgi:aspartate/methionine/tyrosine aminotransferase